jgi:three-Cys-motif partner protein
MPPEDINTKPFDEATLTKLEIFEKYLEAWLPVFINTKNIHSVIVCDPFAGSGYDATGTPGSPIRILRILEKYQNSITDTKTRVQVILSDADTNKAAELRLAVMPMAKKLHRESNGLVATECHDLSFKELFQTQYGNFHNQPNLLFIDQYGIKEIDNAVFQQLISLDKTDFLFFIASSYIRRFIEEGSIRKYFPELDPIALREARNEDIHRIILEYYRSKIRPKNHTLLYPFTFKKMANIYGLIFGAKHPRAWDKFLKIAWQENPWNGEANFDIDDDLGKRQLKLFEEPKLTKLELFERDLENFIFTQGEVTNRELFDFALENGHISRHISNVVHKLRKTGTIEYDGRIGFGYDACYKDRKIKRIKAVKSG